MPEGAAYPAARAARDRFVLRHRGERPVHDPWRHQGVVVEDEPTRGGSHQRVATVFLTGRECPWRCAMCDLWRFTTAVDTPAGAIPTQIGRARCELAAEAPQVEALKLYNAGSFFDPRAVPEADYAAVARTLAGLSRVIVESHPSLVGPRVDRLLAALADDNPLPPALEVAMGLETAHPAALDRLNKHFTVADFARAADALAAVGAAMRVFLLLSPPFVPVAEQDEWLLRSLDTAFASGAAVVSLIPTRSGNGTVEALAAAGLFAAPTLATIERSFALALRHAAGRGIVLLDLWDLDRFSPDGRCPAALRAALAAANCAQRVPA
jgi:radical SAM enzyme (TIGR01210 family)